MKTALVAVAACAPIAACLAGIWVLARKHRAQADGVSLTEEEDAAWQGIELGYRRTASEPPRTS